MTVKTIPLGVCAANCHVVYDNSNNCVIFDPADMGNQLYSYIESLGLKLRAVIITHGHFDHIYGLTQLLQTAKECGACDVRVYIHSLEMPSLTDTSLNLSATLFGCPYTYDGEVIPVSDGQVIDIGDMSFKVLHTPGHTIGSACFAEQNDRVLFTGDTLFKDTCGRTDFLGGSTAQLMASFQKLYELEGDYKVYAGHESDTTLEYERRNNPYMPESSLRD